MYGFSNTLLPFGSDIGKPLKIYYNTQKGFPMPRKLMNRTSRVPRHHVINRGVNRSTVFTDDEDYEMFLKIVCKACRVYKIVF